jgi:hypothetical protein
VRGAFEREHHGRALDERDLPTRLAGALERSSAEQLALAQARPAPSDGGRRAVEEALRTRREKALETAEQRLAAAQQRLGRLGRLGHRAERTELRAEVARQQAALDLAREQLASLPLEPPRHGLAPVVEPRLEPPQSVVGRVRELNLDVGLDL